MFCSRKSFDIAHCSVTSTLIMMLFSLRNRAVLLEFVTLYRDCLFDMLLRSALTRAVSHISVQVCSMPVGKIFWHFERCEPGGSALLTNIIDTVSVVKLIALFTSTRMVFFCTIVLSPLGLFSVTSKGTANRECTLPCSIYNRRCGLVVLSPAGTLTTWSANGMRIEMVEIW